MVLEDEEKMGPEDEEKMGPENPVEYVQSNDAKAFFTIKTGDPAFDLTFRNQAADLLIILWEAKRAVSVKQLIAELNVSSSGAIAQIMGTVIKTLGKKPNVIAELNRNKGYNFGVWCVPTRAGEVVFERDQGQAHIYYRNVAPVTVERPQNGEAGRPQDSTVGRSITEDGKTSNFPILNFNIDLLRCKHFEGREWLFRQIDEKLSAGLGGQAVFIVAAPALGKSAALAAWIQRPTLHTVMAHHFFHHDRRLTLGYRGFIYSLVGQMLRSGPPGYREAVENISLDIIEAAKDTGSLLTLLIVEPLLKSQPASGMCYVIAIDAIDELTDRIRWDMAEDAAIRASFDKPVDFSSFFNLALSLPSWVKLLLTTRPDASVKNFIHSSNSISIADDDIRHQRDIYNFALAELKRQALPSPIRGKSLEEIARLIEQIVAGDFLYADCLLNDQDTLRLGGELPRNFPSYLDSIVRRRIAVQDFENEVRRPLQVLLALKDPSLDTTIASITGVDSSVITRSFRRLSSMFEVDAESRKRQIRHKSIADWLVNDEDDTHEWGVDVKDGINDIKEWLSHRVSLLNQQEREIWLAACIFDGPFNAKLVSQIIEYDHENDLTRSCFQSLEKQSLIEPVYGTLAETNNFRMFSDFRKFGLEELQRAGRYETSKDRLEQMYSNSLREVSQEDFHHQFGQSHDQLQWLIDQLEVLAEEIETSEERFSEIGTRPDEEVLPLLVELMVRGRINLLEKLRDPARLWQSAEHFNVQRVIAQGMYAYLQGDYYKTAELARDTLLNAEGVDEAWMMSMGRSTYALARVLTGQDCDLAAEISQSLLDAEREVARSAPAGQYWSGMAHMQAGTAYWHLMRDKCPELKEETWVPEYTRAVEHYKSALGCLEDIRERVFSVYAMNSLGHLLRLNNDLKLSLKLYWKGFTIAKESKNIRGQLGFAHGMAGWLGWLAIQPQYQDDSDLREAFVKLMGNVESLYEIQHNKMIPPIRTEYNLLWARLGGKPEQLNTSGSFRRKNSKLLKTTLHQAQDAYQRLEAIAESEH